MGKIIDMRNHPLKLEKEMVERHIEGCTLINKNTDFPTCRGYEKEWRKSCEVIKYNKDARIALTRLYITGHL